MSLYPTNTIPLLYVGTHAHAEREIARGGQREGDGERERRVTDGYIIFFPLPLGSPTQRRCGWLSNRINYPLLPITDYR